MLAGRTRPTATANGHGHGQRTRPDACETPAYQRIRTTANGQRSRSTGRNPMDCLRDAVCDRFRERRRRRLRGGLRYTSAFLVSEAYVFNHRSPNHPALTGTPPKEGNNHCHPKGFAPTALKMCVDAHGYKDDAPTALKAPEASLRYRGCNAGYGKSRRDEIFVTHEGLHIVSPRGAASCFHGAWWLAQDPRSTDTANGHGQRVSGRNPTDCLRDGLRYTSAFLVSEAYVFMHSPRTTPP